MGLIPRRDDRVGDLSKGLQQRLGLAVARGLAGAIGATVEAEDTPGGGLTMVVSIPLAGSSADARTPS